MMFLQTTISIEGAFSPASRFSSFGQLFSDIVSVMVSVSGVLAIIFIIIAGIKFVTAGGDPKKIESARGTIIYALIGLAVTALAFVIVQVVQYVFRSNIPIS